MKKYTLGILFALFVGCGVAVGYVVGQGQPEVVVGTALRNAGNATSFWTAATIATFAPDAVVKAAGADPSVDLLPVVFVGEGGVNMPKDKGVSGSASFDLVGQGDEKDDVKVQVTATPDGTAYVKLDNLPSDKGGQDVVKQLNGQWFQLPLRQLAAIISRDSSASPGAAAAADPAVSAKVWARVKDTLTGGELFQAPVPLGAEVIGAVRTLHYSLPVKKDALVLLAEDVKRLMEGREITDEERSAIESDIAARDVTVEVWVNKMTRTLAQANVDSKIAGADGKDEHLSMLFRFTSWNEPVEVQTPADAQKFPDLIASLKKNAGTPVAPPKK